MFYDRYQNTSKVALTAYINDKTELSVSCKGPLLLIPDDFTAYTQYDYIMLYNLVLFQVKVTCRERSWVISRGLADFVGLDMQFHKYVKYKN